MPAWSTKVISVLCTLWRNTRNWAPILKGDLTTCGAETGDPDAVGAALQSLAGQTLWGRHLGPRAASSVYKSSTSVLFYTCHYVNKVRQRASSHKLFGPQFSPLKIYAVQWPFIKPPKFLNFIIVGSFAIKKLRTLRGKWSAKLRSQVNTFTFTRVKHGSQRVGHDWANELNGTESKTRMRRMVTQWEQGLGSLSYSCTAVTTTVREAGWAHNKHFTDADNSWKANYLTEHKAVKTFLIKKNMLVITVFISFFVLKWEICIYIYFRILLKDLSVIFLKDALL